MFTVENAREERMRMDDDLIRDAVIRSCFPDKGFISFSFKDTTPELVNQQVDRVVTALMMRDFTGIEQAELSAGTIHHRIVITFHWDLPTTKADPVVMVEDHLPMYRVSDEDGMFIDTVRIDSPSIANPGLRMDLKRLKLDEKYRLHGYTYTRVF